MISRKLIPVACLQESRAVGSDYFVAPDFNPVVLYQEITKLEAPDFNPVGLIKNQKINTHSISPGK